MLSSTLWAEGRQPISGHATSLLLQELKQGMACRSMLTKVHRHQTLGQGNTADFQKSHAEQHLPQVLQQRNTTSRALPPTATARQQACTASSRSSAVPLIAQVGRRGSFPAL